CLAEVELAAFCARCGQRLGRGATVAVGPPARAADPRQGLHEAFDRGNWLDVLAYARQANDAGTLDEVGVYRAVVALVRLPAGAVFPADRELWLRLGGALSLGSLPFDEQKRFLSSWGELLKSSKVSLEPYRAWFDYACQCWPGEETLWAWRALAYPAGQK